MAIRVPHYLFGVYEADKVLILSDLVILLLGVPGGEFSTIRSIFWGNVSAVDRREIFPSTAVR
jgi:hypothetical protein